MPIELGRSSGEPSEPPEQPYDPAPQRERVRGSIALILVIILSAIVLIPIGLLIYPGRIGTDVEKVLGILLTPVVGLVGTVLGFYFGEKSGR